MLFCTICFLPTCYCIFVFVFVFGKTRDQVCMLSVVHISGPCTYYTLRHKKFPSRAFAFAQNENLSNCRRTNYTSHCHLKKYISKWLSKNQIQITPVLFKSARTSYRASVRPPVPSRPPVHPSATIFPEFIDELKHCRQASGALKPCIFWKPMMSAIQNRTKIQIQTQIQRQIQRQRQIKG